MHVKMLSSLRLVFGLETQVFELLSYHTVVHPRTNVVVYLYGWFELNVYQRKTNCYALVK